MFLSCIIFENKTNKIWNLNLKFGRIDALLSYLLIIKKIEWNILEFVPLTV